MATAPAPVRDLDWDPQRARAFGERALELWEELLRELPELPVRREHPVEEVHAALSLEIPEQPLDDDQIAAHLRTLVMEHSTYTTHPGFFAYVIGSGTVPGAVGDLVAAAMNQNGGGWRVSPGASEIEAQVIAWLASEVGLPPTAAGHIVSGGAMANFTGLKVGRDNRMGLAVRETGVSGAGEVALYASEDSHAVIDRGADMLGLGSAAVRKVAVDAERRMRADALSAAIEADQARGVRPIAVVATAGTTATGAIDPLPDIAELCERHDLWLHVDAAYGGPAVLAPDLAPLLAGIERADSVALDPHKWLYVPFACGCALIRNARHLAESFEVDPSYIWQDEEVHERGGVDSARRGAEFSRGFPALKVWLSLLAHGRDAYARRISHDAALARYLGERVEEEPDFELMTPVSLSVCCFRYAPPEIQDPAALDRLNEALMTAIQGDGRVYCSNAVLDGRFALRVCITNFRTEAEHMDLLLDVARDLGRSLVGTPTA